MIIHPEPVLTPEQHKRLTYGLTMTSLGLGQTLVHPPTAHVYSDNYSNFRWHWNVRHYEDRTGVRTTVTTRWGACTRWGDALEIALAMQSKETAEFWAQVVADVDATGWVRRIPQ